MSKIVQTGYKVLCASTIKTLEDFVQEYLEDELQYWEISGGIVLNPTAEDIHERFLQTIVRYERSNTNE